MGAHVRRPRALLSLPAALPHRRRPVRLLLHPGQSGRETLQSWICFAGRAANRSHREKAAQPFSCPAREYFRSARRAATWAAFSARIGTSRNRNPTRFHSTHVPPEDVVALAIRYGCPSIAFTYNEPTIWGEYVIDICHAAREAGIRTVMVTNGYVTREAFHDIYDHVDAANVDLKSFTEGFYGRVTLTHLQPVLDTLTWLKQETNVWFEVTNLIIPTLNDDPREIRQLSEWMLEHLGPDVPLHFTAFHPDFKLQGQTQDAARDAPRRAADCSRCRTSLRVRRQYPQRSGAHVLPRLRPNSCSTFLARCP